MLPAAAADPLRTHLTRLRAWFEEERRQMKPGVSVPNALASESWKRGVVGALLLIASETVSAVDETAR